jgi:hypothetical protein
MNPIKVDSFTMKMEAVRYSETSAHSSTTQRRNPKEGQQLRNKIPDVIN